MLIQQLLEFNLKAQVYKRNAKLALKFRIIHVSARLLPRRLLDFNAYRGDYNRPVTDGTVERNGIMSPHSSVTKKFPRLGYSSRPNALHWDVAHRGQPQSRKTG